MRVLLLAGLLAGALAPNAFAVEDTKACQVDEMRRSPQESAPPPAPANARQTENAPRAVAVEPTRAYPVRRRGGKRIPDSELIGPRGAL